MRHFSRLSVASLSLSLRRPTGSWRMFSTSSFSLSLSVSRQTSCAKRPWSCLLIRWRRTYCSSSIWKSSTQWDMLTTISERTNERTSEGVVFLRLIACSLPDEHRQWLLRGFCPRWRRRKGIWEYLGIEKYRLFSSINLHGILKAKKLSLLVSFSRAHASLRRSALSY